MRESLGDTLLCLKLNTDKLYHLGIGQAVNKSTLSRANQNKDRRIYQDNALKLIDQAKTIYCNQRTRLAAVLAFEKQSTPATEAD